MRKHDLGGWRSFGRWVDRWAIYWRKDKIILTSLLILVLDLLIPSWLACPDNRPPCHPHSYSQIASHRPSFPSLNPSLSQVSLIHYHYSVLFSFFVDHSPSPFHHCISPLGRIRPWPDSWTSGLVVVSHLLGAWCAVDRNLCFLPSSFLSLPFPGGRAGTG